ncbi:MAG: helix-turn-helix domain-containing protein [Faecalibacterium sp.]
MSAWPTGRALPKKVLRHGLKANLHTNFKNRKKETHEEPPLKLQCPKNGKYYSFQEIQAFYGISRPTLDSWVLKEGIPTMKLGRVKRIQKDAFDEVLKSKRKVEEDV